jgi:hypothetical protein
LWAFKLELPEKVSMTVHRKSAGGVPTDITCTLKFSGGKLAQFDNSFFHSLRQGAEIVGDKVGCGVFLMREGDFITEPNFLKMCVERTTFDEAQRMGQ